MSIELKLSAKTLASCAAAICMVMSFSSANAQQGYRLESVTTLPSTNTGWDYLEFDPARSHLYIAHRADGMQVST